MLNQSADHALRAVLFLAQRADGSCSAEVVAEGIGVPRNYLGKVLHALARAGVVSSVRGPRGGFRLAVPPDRLTLEAVIGPFQQLPKRRVCLLGNRACDPSHPCGVHQRWTGLVEPITAFFRETTIGLLLRPLNGATGARTFSPRPAPAADPVPNL